MKTVHLVVCEKVYCVLAWLNLAQLACSNAHLFVSNCIQLKSSSRAWRSLQSSSSQTASLFPLLFWSHGRFLHAVSSASSLCSVLRSCFSSLSSLLVPSPLSYLALPLALSLSLLRGRLLVCVYSADAGSLRRASFR